MRRGSLVVAAAALAAAQPVADDRPLCVDVRIHDDPKKRARAARETFLNERRRRRRRPRRRRDGGDRTSRRPRSLRLAASRRRRASPSTAPADAGEGYGNQIHALTFAAEIALSCGLRLVVPKTGRFGVICSRLGCDAPHVDRRDFKDQPEGDWEVECVPPASGNSGETVISAAPRTLVPTPK